MEKKHKNRIEIVGAHYIRIIIGRNIFESQNFYETRGGVLRAVHRIKNSLWCSGHCGFLPIYDYDGCMPGIGNEKAKFKVLEI